MTNKLGVHALVWVGGWSHDECERAIAQTAELGFDLIEIPALDPSSIDTTFTRRMLDRYHLGTTLSLGLDDSTDISSGDPAKQARGEARLMEVLRVAGDIGATHVCGILYSAFQKYFEPPTPTGIAGSVEVLRRVGEKAAQHGITIGLEVVNRYESNVLNTAAQAVAFARRVGLPNVKVHLDTYHMNIEESDLESALIDTGEMLGYFHIGESGRGYLGAGNIDFDRVFRGLVKAGYEGPITFESFSSAVVNKQLQGILGIWRNLWEDGADLARHAKGTIEHGLKAAREAHARSTLP
ncbi:sugar phosphate isomerase/epimerase family protein [Variovorax sp. J2P1-59]|uniref:sugar phosphate isomerase/epimerase family protein n=1 Tax=Variovorax flavidus TaxID=3053501 RepID=UPI00257661C9|nr:sugar phosphate isomerase/epimerase family protein [Variovorax sp. J2P1-59]MDM0078807.1 sugar phosphate isomerase/epimerase family protein [Variovorax sp. J2P1-59]